MSLSMVITYEPVAGQQTQLSLVLYLFQISLRKLAISPLEKRFSLGYLSSSSAPLGLFPSSFIVLWPLNVTVTWNLYYFSIGTYQITSNSVVRNNTHMYYLTDSLGHKPGHSLTRSSVGLQSRSQGVLGVSSEFLTREEFISKLKQLFGRVYFLKTVGVRAPCWLDPEDLIRCQLEAALSF